MPNRARQPVESDTRYAKRRLLSLRERAGAHGDNAPAGVSSSSDGGDNGNDGMFFCAIECAQVPSEVLVLLLSRHG